MSDQRWLFKNYTAIPPGSWEINGIGDTRIQAEGYGDVQLVSTVAGQKQNGDLKNVLYVPGLGVNLISIGCITENGSKVTFHGSEVTIDFEGRLQMTRKRTGISLYRLNITTPNIQNASTAAKATVPITLWHKRLAHINYDSILKMAKKNEVTGLDIPKNSKPPEDPCVGCALGKMHRLPFPTGKERATKIGELIHSDVCGAMETTTPRVFDNYKSFEHTLFTETNNKIKTLRTDNGGVYKSGEFENWLKQNGTRHETSIPYSPQQNGMAGKAIEH